MKKFFLIIFILLFSSPLVFAQGEETTGRGIFYLGVLIIFLYGLVKYSNPNIETKEEGKEILTIVFLAIFVFEFLPLILNQIGSFVITNETGRDLCKSLNSS